MSLFKALDEFWRVDNKHGLYPQRESFTFKVNYSGVILFSIVTIALAMAIIMMVI
jgi:hypothetical protein